MSKATYTRQPTTKDILSESDMYLSCSSVLLLESLEKPCEYSWTNKQWKVCQNCLLYTEYRFCNGEIIHLYELCSRHTANEENHLVDDIWFWQQQAATGQLESAIRDSVDSDYEKLLPKDPTVVYLHAGGCNYSSGTHATMIALYETVSCYLEAVSEMRSRIANFGCENCLRKFTPPITESVMISEVESDLSTNLNTFWYRSGLLKEPEYVDLMEIVFNSKGMAVGEQAQTIVATELSDTTTQPISNIEPLVESPGLTQICAKSFDSNMTRYGNIAGTHACVHQIDIVKKAVSHCSLPIEHTDLPEQIISTHLPQLSPHTVQNVPNPEVDPIAKHCEVCVNDLAQFDKELSHPAAVLRVFSKRCNLISHNLVGSYLHSNIHATDSQKSKSDPRSAHDQEASHSFIPFHVLKQHEENMLDAKKPAYTNDTFIETFWRHNQHLRRRSPEIWEKLNGLYDLDSSCGKGGHSWREPLVLRLREEGVLRPDEDLVPLNQKTRPGEYVIGVASTTRETGACEATDFRYRRIKDMTDEPAWW